MRDGLGFKWPAEFRHFLGTEAWDPQPGQGEVDELGKTTTTWLQLFQGWCSAWKDVLGLGTRDPIRALGLISRLAEDVIMTIGFPSSLFYPSMASRPGLGHSHQMQSFWALSVAVEMFAYFHMPKCKVRNPMPVLIMCFKFWIPG